MRYSIVWLLLSVLITAATRRSDAADAQRLTPSSIQFLPDTGTFQTLIFDASQLNTPGGPLGVAWQDGLYTVSGSLTLLPLALAGAKEVEGRVLVNGQMVDRFQRSFSVGTEGWNEIAFSIAAQMNANDQVQVQLDYSSELGGNLHVSDFSNLSLTSFTSGAADAQRLTPSAIQFLPDTGTFQTLNFDTAPLNTPNSPAGVAWQDGLYTVSGSLTLLPLALAGAKEVEGRVLVNGVMVDRFQRSFSVGTEGWNEIAFSVAAQMGADDQVQVQLDYSSEFGGTLHVSDFSNLSVTGFTPGTADAQRLTPSAIQFLADTGTFQTLIFDASHLNTPGSSPGVAWDDGLYTISGSLTLLPLALAGAKEVEGRVLVNGVMVDRFQRSFSVGTEGWNEIAFSFAAQMSAGDQVQVQLDYSSELGGNLHVSDFSNLSIVRLHAVPEPSGFALMLVALFAAPTAFRKGSHIRRQQQRNSRRDEGSC